MKKIIFCLLILFAIKFANAQVNDQFTDGNFSSNPTWLGDTSKFIVNQNFQLQLNAPAIADTASISTISNRLDSTEWQFWVKLDFSPSTSNQLRAYLSSDSMNLKKTANGYFIQMGTSGSNDSIELFKQVASVKTKIGGGLKGHCGKNTNSLRLKIRRDLIGNWTIWSDTLGGNDFSLEFTCFDTSVHNSSYMGFWCNYSSTRSTKFYFDDVYAGSNIYDVTPPTVVNVTPISSTQIDVLFSESVQLSSSENVVNYFVNNGIGNALNATRDAANTSLVHLTFVNSFQNKNYQITVSNIADVSGNIMTNQTLNFTFYKAKAYDVVIDEIMANPNPPVGLPNGEYVELKNVSRFSIDLYHWMFTDTTKVGTIISHFILQPDSFVLLCGNSIANTLQQYGNLIVGSSLPPLNNDGDKIMLYDADTNLIHSVNYDLSFYQSTFKQNGGWSLEMIDTKNPCNGNNNWKASNDASGGTPGRKNSVDGINPDNTSPDLIRAFPTSNNSVEIFFSEPMNVSALSNLQNFVVDNSIGNPVNAAFGRYSEQSIVLTFANNFQPKTIYTITINAISDCSGNLISINTAKFGLPETIDSIDVVLNEVLFYPKTYGNRFVEIYNRSNKIIDLSKLKIANADASGNLNTAVFAQKNGYLFFQNDYVSITDSRDNILQNYSTPNPNGVLEISSVPTLDDHNGTIALINPSGKIIDELTYSDAWHYPLLHNKQGVSLERISIEAKTQDENNWHSAASVVGFATPAYRNSESISSISTNAEIDLEPKVFTPDEDGKNDILTIRYYLDNAGYNANINIYNSLGVLVKTICNNQTLEQSGFFQWDGTDASGNKLNKGIYIVYAELFNAAGKKINFKKDCVLSGKE